MIPLREYPRPQTTRPEDSWRCLNGTWQYAMEKGGLPQGTEARMPPAQGEIVVPYSPESELSGVERQLQPDEVLWYERSLDEADIPSLPANGRLLLHFGAVDQSCRVYLNGQLAGSHEGGYFAFTLDITALMQPRDNRLTVAVTDPSNTGYRAWGKQSLKPGGIWYRATSGIWQTVWLEAVPQTYIQNIRITPDCDGSRVQLQVQCSGEAPLSGVVSAPAQAGQTTGGVQMAVFLEESPGVLTASLPDLRAWSPEDPYLYTFTLRCRQDEVQGYFGMRSFGLCKDAGGIPRLSLNGKPYVPVGVLDQGYWQQGMYTPLSDQAMVDDITQMQALGFNIMRKHIKIEPMRWYYHCDRLGMLVWQDMVSGGGPYKPALIQVLPVLGVQVSDRNAKAFGRGSVASRAAYQEELEATIAQLYSVPSLALWVPFNEGWGQFDAAEAARRTRVLDPTRPLDHASGWHDQQAGDLKSRHIYFSKCRIRPDRHGRPAALTEYGGYSYPVPGHTYSQKAFGYKRYKDLRTYQQAVLGLMDGLLKDGRNIAAFVYTQLSDVEEETNGLVTFDRQVSKWPPGSQAAEQLRQRNLALRRLAEDTP